jgi:phenylalanyl-tRNA synthetase beta chain
MKLTYNWLKDFVDIKLSPEALAEKLTMAGLEVTSLEKKGGDCVFEIEITSNRPDWLSVVGIAREVAAITGRKMKQVTRSQGHKVTRKILKDETCDLKIKIGNKKDCPLYTAKIVRGVNVGPSSDWLRERLELIGCRTINNVVDITNYVLFTWGEPLHAFDLDKLSQDTLFVRRAMKGEKVTTIDAEVKALDPEVLVIADSGHVLAIAGIMGGKDTEVTERTKNILLEGAVFDPIVIRRGRQKLSLQTDSSYRFERGVDAESAQAASWQAINLIEEFAQGQCTLAKSMGFAKTQSRRVNLSLTAVRKILNIEMAPATAKGILTRLGFTVRPAKAQGLSVLIPGYRPDVKLDVDLIEEIARILGYDQMPKSLPRVNPQVLPEGQREKVSLTKDILTGLGLNEVITYSLIGRELLKDFGFSQAEDALEILNPLSKEQEVLRPSLLPSLCQSVAVNLNQKQEAVNIFELARVYLKEETGPKEELMLAIALCGSRSLWLEQGVAKDEANILHLKGITETLFERLGITDYDFSSAAGSPVADIYAGKVKVGGMMVLSDAASDRLGIKNKQVFLLQVSLEKVFSLAVQEKRFTPLPKYPAVTRDISLVLKDSISVKEVLVALKEQGGDLLSNVRITDQYKGKQIPDGTRGLTISCLYRSEEKTLTETEVAPLHAKLNSILVERFGARIR